MNKILRRLTVNIDKLRRKKDYCRLAEAVAWDDYAKKASSALADLIKYNTFDVQTYNSLIEIADRHLERGKEELRLDSQLISVSIIDYTLNFLEPLFEKHEREHRLSEHILQIIEIVRGRDGRIERYLKLMLTFADPRLVPFFLSILNQGTKEEKILAVGAIGVVYNPGVRTPYSPPITGPEDISVEYYVLEALFNVLHEQEEDLVNITIRWLEGILGNMYYFSESNPITSKTRNDPKSWLKWWAANKHILR